MEKFLKGHLKWIVANVILWTVAKVLFLAIKLWGVKSTVFHAVVIPVEMLSWRWLSQVSSMGSFSDSSMKPWINNVSPLHF